MIAGKCKLFARKRNVTTNTFDNCWFDLPQAARSYSELEELIEYYQSEWGNFYEYHIVANVPACYPKPHIPMS